MHGPLVTVGICVRNSEETIEMALQSIVHQHYPHHLIELIIVDDGSEDRTLMLIKNYLPNLDMRVKLFERQWAGLGSARNLVAQNASGKYIIWLDGDMILPADHIKKQVDFMEKNPRIGIAKARYANHAQENLVGFLENAAYQAVDFKYSGVTERSLGAGGSIYRVDAIKQVGGFNENIKGAGEDLDIEYRIRKKGWLLFLGTNAFFYELRRKSWCKLWKEGYWHGYKIHLIYRMAPGVISLIKLSPFGGFIAGLLYSKIAYMLHHKKRVFLLPIQYSFKRFAFFIGFASGQIKKT
ncbi:MAG: glycosyltransferase [Candidatus Bathyarchaeia archaeon]